MSIKVLSENPLSKMTLEELLFRYNILDEIILDNPKDPRIKKNGIDTQRWLLLDEIKRRPRPRQVIRLGAARVYGRSPKP